MNKILFYLSLVIYMTGHSQTYFQQKVDYELKVKLNDKTHSLSGFEKFIYTNNSPDTLQNIYIHIWPNAYKNSNTALAKQLIKNGDIPIGFVAEKHRGYIDSLNFKINGDSCKWSLDAIHIDIVNLTLNNPLFPGESINVSTPFKVKIPSGKISRLGHIGDSYQITQWFPKPAVYDNEGWHQMPYLNQGEFYSEFGSFEVAITLPKNYIVGATGDLQTKEELIFLEDKAELTKGKFKNKNFGEKSRISKSKQSYPKSDSIYKTLVYTQNNVHDFAWFADKRYEVSKGETILPHSKRKVTTWAMFTPENAMVWEDAIEYINDATYYYSKWNGDYQYNQVTAVDGTISAGGGMEYPNVTVIGNSFTKQSLEIVIVHEVGHNWFYGMLGSNERDHPWMDEGLNTLNEIRYIETKYPDNTLLSDQLFVFAKIIHAEHLSHHSENDLTYLFSAGLGKDQPIELESEKYTSFNYGAIVYAKTGLVFTYLKDYLGEELFDKCMQKYFEEWHFKHPQPRDFRSIMETVSQKNLSWLFEEIIPTTKHIDFKISGVKQKDNNTYVTVKNNGQINGPFRVDAYNLGKHKSSIIVEPNNKKTTVSFLNQPIDEIRIDGRKRIPETNRTNNIWLKNQPFKKMESINFEFLVGDNEPDKTTSWILPIGGYNVYDNIMLGVAFHNYSLPRNNFEYIIAPMFSTGRTNFSGMSYLKYTKIPAKYFKSIIFGLDSRTFGFKNEDKNSHYISINPSLKLNIGKPKNNIDYYQSLKIQGSYNIENTNSTDFLKGSFAKYNFNYIGLKHHVNLQFRTDYIQSTITTTLNGHFSGSYSFNYSTKNKKWLKTNIYFGKNLYRSGVPNDRFGLALSGQSGEQDFFFEQFIFNRNATTSLGSQRKRLNHGNFSSVSKLTFGDHLATINMHFDIPLIPDNGTLPKFVGFADFGVVNNNFELTTIYQFGLGAHILKETLGLYVPLYENLFLKDSYESHIDSIWKRVRFSVNLSFDHLQKIIEIF